MLVHNPTITGSLVVSGSIITTGTLTGDYNYTELSGIPQGIISSSNQIDLVFNLDGVISSSNQFNALSNTSASYVTNQENFAKKNTDNTFTGTQTFNNINVNGTGSFSYTEVTGSFTGSFSGDGSNLTGVVNSTSASYAQQADNATSASYALTASYAENAGGGGGVGFPFSGSAVITGSLLVTEGVSANSFTETSALRFKEGVTDLEPNDFIHKLRPVRFVWKQDKKDDIGLIAEEVQDIIPELVGLDQEGQVQGVKYSKITSLLIKAVQDQQKQINELKEEVAVLKKS